MTRPQSRYKKGDRIGGRYQVHQALMGGMGEVYLCLDLEQNYPYALKTFQQRYQSQALQHAFEQEVSTWITLERHPNIVRCHWMQVLDNQPFMCLDWIAGEEGKGSDLRGWLQKGPMKLKTALDIAIDICRGLVHAAEKQPGLVHRDLKPENILVAQGGQAKITDFGLAQIVLRAGLEVSGLPEAETSLITKQQQSLMGGDGVAGTPAYMPPEQWQPGAQLDARSDIYALGCVLYEMLVGRPPFKVDSSTSTSQQWFRKMQQQHENAPLPPIPVELPSGLQELLNSCLAKYMDQRPSTLITFLSHLTDLYREIVGQLPSQPLEVGSFTVVDYSNRGYTYCILHQYERALLDFKEALQIDPNDAATYSNRGITYHSLQQYKQALADYNKALQLDPNLAQAYSNRGIAYHTLQQHEQALSDYNRALRLDPSYAGLYVNRGVTYHSLLQYEQALADYNKALQLDPNLAKAYYGRGNVLVDLQHYEIALTDYNKALLLDPNYVKVYFNRGNIYFDLQQYERALTDYNKALQLDPNLAQAYYNRGNIYFDLQQYEQALTDYNETLRLDPNHANAYLNIGVIYGNQKRYQSALSYFKKAAQLGSSQGAQHAGQVMRQMGLTPSPSAHPGQQAFVAFQKVASPATMAQAVAQHPFMTEDAFIATVEQIINQQVPPEQQPTFQQQLAWLRQIAGEQKS